jgi:hypothetical protein
MFPLWLLQFLVIGGVVLCATGVVALIAMLIIDSLRKRIW